MYFIPVMEFADKNTFCVGCLLYTSSHFISLALEESRIHNGQMIDMDTYIKNI